jgi:hypothetical protein
VKIQLLVKNGSNINFIGSSFRIGKKYPGVLFCYECLKVGESYIVTGNVKFDRFKKVFGKIDFRSRVGQASRHDIRTKIFDLGDSKLASDIISSKLKFDILARVVENVEDCDRAYKIVTKFFINFDFALTENLYEQDAK